MKDMIKEIISDISDQEIGTFPDFGSNLYKPLKINADNFHNIDNKYNSEKQIAFIDGGNNEIISSPNFSLQFIRIYSCIYQDNKRKKSKKYEFYSLAKAVNKEGKIFYEVQIYPINYELKIKKFNSFDKSLKTGDHRINISKIGEIVRKLAEIDIAGKILDELDNKDIIIRDGDLLASQTYESEFFKQLYEKAEQKEIIVCGVSKTTRLITDTGYSLVAALDQISEGEKWFYYPLVENNNPNHPADIYLIKLHDKSKYCFRFEVYNKINYEVDELLSILGENSKDPVLFGYPYGLIEADRFARVSNSEIESLRMRLKYSAGEKWKQIEKSLNSIDAHSILDNIR